MFQVIGVKSVAPAYGDIVPQDVGEKDGVADEDPLGIESAFTKSGPGILDVSTVEDPLGLDAAFDAAFPCAGGDASDSLSSGSVASPDVSDENASAESDRDESDIGSNPEDEEPGNFVSAARRMRRSPSFARVGNRVLWNNVHIGTISAWGKNISCHCRIHAGCRSPASTMWGTDQVLELWLLEAIDSDGVQRVDQATHQTRVAALRAHARLLDLERPVLCVCVCVKLDMSKRLGPKHRRISHLKGDGHVAQLLDSRALCNAVHSVGSMQT